MLQPLRLGLCCTFAEQDIKFRSATATATARLERAAQLEKLSRLVAENAEALGRAIAYCGASGIGAFRIQSQILPVKTHPQVGYRMEELPGGEALVERFRAAGASARAKGVRLLFHPDQFVVLGSPRPEVVEASIAELEYQAEVAEWVGADVVNVHGGGAYDDRPAALERLAAGIERLSPRVRERLTLENDDRVWRPEELLPVCRALGVPLVYDVHHHRCLPDGLDVPEATAAAFETWDREPVVHLSSPLDGWDGPRPGRHHDYIDPADIPTVWRGLPITVEVEAKAKELAIARLAAELPEAGVPAVPVRGPVRLAGRGR